MTDQYLAHHGIKGMKWGKRNGPPYPLSSDVSTGHRLKTAKTNSGFSHGKSNNSGLSKQLSNGRTLYRTGYEFNRVGGPTLQFNKAGGLYVSSGEKDAARYIKALGPSLLGNLLKTSSTHLQKIKVTSDLKSGSADDFRYAVLDVISKNPKLAKNMADSIYALAFEMDDNFNKVNDMSSADFIKKACNDPNGKAAKQWSHLANTLLGDSEFSTESKAICKELRSKGFDAVPDLHDIASGTSETALIILNPDKVQLVSSTVIDKNTYKEAKKFVRSLGKLPVTELTDLYES